MKRFLSNQALSLKAHPFEHWAVVGPLVAIVALAVNFAPWLFALIMGGALFYYFWNHREKLVVFLLLYTPFEELILKALPDSLYAPVRFMWEGMLLVMMALMLVERIGLAKSWKKSLIDKLLLVFVVGWLLSGIVNSIPATTSLLHIKNLVRYIPIFYIIYNLKFDQELIRKVTTAIVVMGVIQALICLGQAIEGNVMVSLFQPREVVVGGELIRGLDVQIGSYHTKFSGSFARSNDLGNYLAFAICFAVAAYFTLGRKRAYVLALLPMLAALMVSSSRISLLSAFLGVGMILIKIEHPRRYIYFIVPILLAFLLTAGIRMTDTSIVHDDFRILEKIYYAFTPEFIDIMVSTGRLYAVFNAVPAVFFANPILGIGPGSFMHISQQMSADEVYAMADSLDLHTGALKYVHDVGYAALFVQVGLLGLISMVWIFGRIYRKACSLLSRTADNVQRTFLLGAVGLFIALAIQNLASFNLTYRNQSIVVWIVCGLIVMLAARETKQSSEESERN